MSRRLGNVALLSARNSLAASLASWVSMPSTSPPWEAIFSCVFCSIGISSRHGSHHEAHMLSTTTLPL